MSEEKRGIKRISFDSSYLETIVCPAAKLHLAILIIKREPRNVHRATRHEDACKVMVMTIDWSSSFVHFTWWNIGACTLAGHHDICGIC